jgi:predicted nucleotidyltransferase
MKIDSTKVRGLIKSRGVSNSMLASDAGITRQALQALLKAEGAVEVRDKTVKGLVRAFRLTDESFLSPDPLAGYKQAVADQHADLPYIGLGLSNTHARPIDEMYVAVRVVPRPDRKRDEDCSPVLNETEDEPIPEASEVPVDDCIKVHHRMLICGEPGSGKTTAMRHVARLHARNTDGGRVPLFVRLADFAKARESDCELGLVRFVVTRTLPDASSEYWSHLEKHLLAGLDRGDCLVLLDGLDEVGCDGRFSSVLTSFVKQFCQNRFVLTSRIVGLDARPWHELDFAAFQIAQWGDADIEQFARNWYLGQLSVSRVQKKQLEQRAKELTNSVTSQDSLRALASNPLMLTILAALHYYNASLPRRRVDLYAKIVEVTLENWEAAKRGARSGDPLHGIALEARELSWLLDRLALGMQREGRTLRPRWWVDESVQQFLRGELALDGEKVKEQSERVIRYLCERSGLLAERGDGVYGFFHRTFQEYFAALGLLRETEGGGDIIAHLRPYLYHPQWQEVVVHVAAMLSATPATALLRVILDDPNQAGRFIRRAQRLSLRCLANGSAVSDSMVLNQIFSDGDVIGKSRWLGVTIEINRLLREIRGTRYSARAEDMLQEIEAAARKNLPESDYVIEHLACDGFPAGPKDALPGTVCKKRLGSRCVKLVWPALDMRENDPSRWLSEVMKRIRDKKAEIASRLSLISMLAEEAESNEEVQRVLKDRLQRDPHPRVRAECAESLDDLASKNPGVAQLLVNRLDKDSSQAVRKRCAESLGKAAMGQSSVRLRLEELSISATEQVRVGAIRGLSRLDLTAKEQEPLLKRLLTTATTLAEPASVRSASIYAIGSVLGKIDAVKVRESLEECLDDNDPDVRYSALHAFADAIAGTRTQWPEPLIKKVESLLMDLTEPCPHLSWDLEIIVDLQEVHSGRILERTLNKALTALAESIKLAFVFGSLARLKQDKESDVDLMIVGDARLKDLAAALHSVEESLGRTINPVLFSAEKFREQYREGNPLLLDVVRKEKIFLKGDRDELTKLVADRSPD